MRKPGTLRKYILEKYCSEKYSWKRKVWKNNVGHSFQKMYVSRSVVYERSVMIQRHRQKIEKKILSLISGIDVQDRF